MRIGLIMSVCSHDSTREPLDLDEIWCGRYAIGDYPKIISFNFLHLVISTW
jgi:hypothetical protein